MSIHRAPPPPGKMRPLYESNSPFTHKSLAHPQHGWRLLWFFGVCVVLWSVPASSWAKEYRLALLVANQRGWKGDPKLSYVLNGDLRPLAIALRRLGFTVKTLENQRAGAVRRAFKWVQRQLKGRPQTTFLFYYSGHADQRHFHLGKKGKRPLNYKEFASFLSRLRTRRRIAIIDSCYSGEIIRQFGSLSRYQRLFRKGRRKGVRARRALHIRKLLLPEQGKEQGVRIISSSLDFAWELDRYRASIFTYHLLRGLRKAADLNRDGKITVDELFDFASREVHQETGQRPQQLVLVKREQPYALAPAYNSRLWIDARVVGKLKISVANFLWQQTKKDKKPLRLAVVDGRALVHWQHRKQCWRQRLYIPKGGEVRLSSRWQRVPCRRWARVKKGSVLLPARRFDTLIADTHRPEYEPSATTLALSLGFAQAGAAALRAPHMHIGALLRWRWLGVGLQYQAGFPNAQTYWLSRIWLHTEAGWPIHFRLGTTAWTLFPGFFFQAGTTIQHAQAQASRQVISLGTGGKLSLSWMTTQRFGVRVAAHAGIDYTPVRNQTGLSFYLQLHAAAVLFFR